MDECRFRNCEYETAEHGFCAQHLTALKEDPSFLPLRSVPIEGGEDETVRQTLCALCGEPVWVLKRIDGRGGRPWPLETSSHPEGRCRIIDGGFSVQSLVARDQLRADKVPLYRTHPPVCVERAKIVGG